MEGSEIYLSRQKPSKKQSDEEYFKTWRQLDEYQATMKWDATTLQLEEDEDDDEAVQ